MSTILAQQRFCTATSSLPQAEPGESNRNDNVPQSELPSSCLSESLLARSHDPFVKRLGETLRKTEVAPVPPPRAERIRSVEAETHNDLPATKPAKDRYVKGKRSNLKDWLTFFRAVYNGEKYWSPYLVSLLGNICGKSGTSSPTKLAKDPHKFFGSESGSSSTGSGVTDFIINSFNGPFAALIAWRCGKLAWFDNKQRQKYQADLAKLEKEIKELEQKNPNSPLIAWKKFKADNLRDNIKLNKEAVKENFHCALNMAGASLLRDLSLITKVMGFISQNGISFGPAATLGATAIIGMVATFALAPVSTYFLTTESWYLLKRAKKALKIHNEAASGTQSRLEKLGNMTFATDMLRKHGIRSRFYENFLKFNKFRMASNSLLSVGLTAKMGIGIAGLVAGGFTLSNPIGWGITGAMMAVAGLCTVAVFVFAMGRTLGRYDSYRRDGHEEHNRDLHLALEGIDVASLSRKSLRALLGQSDNASEPSSTASSAASKEKTRHGLLLSMEEYRALRLQKISHKAFTHRVLGRAPITGARGMAQNFVGRVGSFGLALGSLVFSLNVPKARKVYRQSFALKSAHMTAEHVRQEIERGGPAWIDFMKAHCESQKSFLKGRLEAIEIVETAWKRDGNAGKVNQENNEFGTKSLNDQRKKDTDKINTIDKVLSSLTSQGNNAPFDVEAREHLFLKVLSEIPVPKEISRADVQKGLVDCLSKHYTRSNRDRIGVMYETEQHKTRLLQKLVENKEAS